MSHIVDDSGIDTVVKELMRLCVISFVMDSNNVDGFLRLQKTPPFIPHWPLGQYGVFYYGIGRTCSGLRRFRIACTDPRRDMFPRIIHSFLSHSLRELPACSLFHVYCVLYK